MLRIKRRASRHVSERTEQEGWMLFNSLEYIVFLPLVVAAYFALPQRHRWILLLTASYYFYACWKAEYLLLIVFSTSIDYWAGLRMGRYETKKQRRPYLLFSLITNLGTLFAFKYFNFFNDSARVVFDQLNIFYDVPAFDVLLPVGISFYTFQTLAYSIDVYRGIQKPERHLGIFALYVTFFPQLVAGPIERSTNLIPQFRQTHSFSYERTVDGLKLIMWGFFKKLVIADRVAYYVNQVYGSPEMYGGAPILLATYLFAFQIFCDFSAYTDIAIGSARIMGYELMENFRRPYFSKSIREFWSRWHISLSTWFRDYLYIPLGGNRVAKARWYFNLFFVFLVSGLWHGAAWTFVIWGSLHGLYLIAGILTSRARDKAWNWFEGRLAVVRAYQIRTAGFVPLPSSSRMRDYAGVFMTFHLVLFAWVFFRAESVSDAFLLIERMFSLDAGHTSILGVSAAMGAQGLAIALCAIGIMEVVHLIERKRNVWHFLAEQPAWIRWPIYYVLGFAVLFFGVFTEQAFIYFQF